MTNEATSVARRNRLPFQIACTALVYFCSGVAAVDGSVVMALLILLQGYLLTALFIRQGKVGNSGASTQGQRAANVSLILLSLVATLFLVGFLGASL